MHLYITPIFISACMSRAALVPVLYQSRADEVAETNEPPHNRDVSILFLSSEMMPSLALLVLVWRSQLRFYEILF